MQVAALQLAAIFHASLVNDSPFESQINSILERWRILQSLSITLDESVIAIAIIIALPEAYSTLKSILLSQSAAPKIDSVKNSILAEEQVRKATTGATAIALKANVKGKPAKGMQDAKGNAKEKKPKCGFCGRTGHGEDECCKKKTALESLET